MSEASILATMLQGLPLFVVWGESKGDGRNMAVELNWDVNLPF